MDDLVTVAEDNYRHMFRTLGTLAPGGRVREADGILHICTTAGLPTFNPTVASTLPADVDALLDDALAFHTEAASPAWCIVVRATDSDRFAAVGEPRGFAKIGEEPFMVLPELAESPPPDGLQVRAATDLDGFREHMTVAAQGFGFPIELVERLMVEQVQDDWFTALIGEVGGQAVTTSLVCPSTTEGVQVAGVYNVSTVPSHRGRGLGEAMTRWAAELGRRRGCTMATLQASAMGFPIYERMGYSTVSTWHLYAPVVEPIV